MIDSRLQETISEIAYRLSQGEKVTQTESLTSQFKIRWGDNPFSVYPSFGGTDERLKAFSSSGLRPDPDLFLSLAQQQLNNSGVNNTMSTFTLNESERNALINTLQPLGWDGMVQQLNSGVPIAQIISGLTPQEQSSLFHTIEPLGWTGLANQINPDNIQILPVVDNNQPEEQHNDTGGSWYDLLLNSQPLWQLLKSFGYDQPVRDAYNNFDDSIGGYALGGVTPNQDTINDLTQEYAERLRILELQKALNSLPEAEGEQSSFFGEFFSEHKTDVMIGGAIVLGLIALPMILKR